jgi:hypothetical protein
MPLDYKLIQALPEINQDEDHVLFTWGNESYPGIEAVNLLA